MVSSRFGREIDGNQPLTNIFHTSCKIWIHYVQFEYFFKPLSLAVYIHTAYLHPYTMPCSHSAQYMIHEPRPRGYLAHCANGKLDWISSSFQKGKGKCHLLQSRGSTFWPHSSRQSMTKTMRWMSAVFCIQFTWGQMELQLRDCRTCEWAPWSAYLDHLTQWQQGTSGTREVWVWAQWSQGASQGCGERSSVALYWIIWINNQTLQLQRKLLSLRTRPEENAVGCRL